MRQGRRGRGRGGVCGLQLVEIIPSICRTPFDDHALLVALLLLCGTWHGVLYDNRLSCLQWSCVDQSRDGLCRAHNHSIVRGVAGRGRDNVCPLHLVHQTGQWGLVFGHGRGYCPWYLEFSTGGDHSHLFRAATLRECLATVHGRNCFSTTPTHRSALRSAIPVHLHLRAFPGRQWRRHVCIVRVQHEHGLGHG